MQLTSIFLTLYADKALRTAISKVKDGKQILVDIIPVGELYLE